MRLTRWAAIAVAAGAAAAGIAVGGAGAASASPNPTITLPIHYSDGVTMDAINWAGTNTSASCATGAVNDTVVNNGTEYLDVWQTSHAGCAGNFLTVPVTGGGASLGSYEIVYAPNGVVATNGGAAGDGNGYCASTYANVSGTQWRLRHCAATIAFSGGVYSASYPTGSYNPWQTFVSSAPGQFDSNAVFIQTESVLTTSNLVANDGRYSGDGGHVISYAKALAYNAANEGWTINS